jgi:hypothetical protein
MREKARQRKAEKFTIGALRHVEERDGIPVVLLDSYADAVNRYGLRDLRMGDDRPTPGEIIDEARARFQEHIEAMTEFVLNGGRDRWQEFEKRFAGYVAAAALAVVTAQRALRENVADFSEYTDPAFAGLIEGDTR